MLVKTYVYILQYNTSRDFNKLWQVQKNADFLLHYTIWILMNFRYMCTACVLILRVVIGMALVGLSDSFNCHPEMGQTYHVVSECWEKHSPQTWEPGVYTKYHAYAVRILW